MSFVPILAPSSVIEELKFQSPKSRVELHVHLDGSMRRETLWELLKQKKMPLPGDGSFRAFEKAVSVQKPKDLGHFLSAFPIFLPAIKGDLQAIKRISLEFSEDLARNGVLYAEPRFCPHLMLSEDFPEVKAKHVVQTVLEGLREGEQLYGVKARVILCCLSGVPQFSEEVLQLCQELKNEGVVGIDIAGDEGAIRSSGDSEVFTDFDKEIFQKAKNLGIHRTVHAGEDGPSVNVKVAVEEMFAERIGHGYRIMQDSNLYQKCKHSIHFETCPTSSILTGSVKMTDALMLQHPVLQMAKDNANFSINTDDTTVTGTGLQDEFDLLRTWGLNEVQFTRASLNAAKSCFLPENEKKELIKQINQIFGFE